MNRVYLYAVIIFSVFVFSCNGASSEKVKVEESNNVKPVEKLKSVEEADSEKLLYTGQFHNADKTGSGTVGVYETKDGKRTIRLKNFKTASGPDLFVYIYKAKDAKNSSVLKKVEFVSLGLLKKQRGDQEYEIPASVDLESFRAVSIWCKEFGVNFATAPLEKV